MRRLKTLYGQDVDVVQDNWTMGYTPNVVVGVWSGNANDAPLDNVIGVTGAAPIWHSAITTADGYCQPDDLLPCPTDVTPKSLGIAQQDTFPMPAGVSKYTTNMVNGLAPAAGLPATSDYIIDGLQPTTSGLFTQPTTQPGKPGQPGQPQPTPTG